MTMDDWPDCAIEGCPRKCCLALDSVYCFPHTEGNEHVKRWKIDAQNADYRLSVGERFTMDGSEYEVIEVWPSAPESTPASR